MYVRWSLAILALIGTTLACALFETEPELGFLNNVDDPSQIRNADITLDIGQAKSSAGSDTPAPLGWGCWPPHHNKEGSDSDLTGSFTVSAFKSGVASQLDGKCSSSNGAKATLTGTIDWDTERIEFTLVITSSQQLNVSETIEGNGYFVSQSLAEGNANWSMTCVEKEKSGYLCPAAKADGTVPWTMKFAP
jgi:hypothetical protein